MKDIPLELAQHKIELDTSIPLAHQVRYRLNPNYVATIKQDIDKLLAIEFIQPIKEATWLSPIVVVLKKNGKMRICDRLGSFCLDGDAIWCGKRATNFPESN